MQEVSALHEKLRLQEAAHQAALEQQQTALAATNQQQQVCGTSAVRRRAPCSRQSALSAHPPVWRLAIAPPVQELVVVQDELTQLKQAARSDMRQLQVELVRALHVGVVLLLLPCCCPGWRCC